MAPGDFFTTTRSKYFDEVRDNKIHQSIRTRSSKTEEALVRDAAKQTLKYYEVSQTLM